MQSRSVAVIIVRLLAGLSIMLAAFWITLQVLDSRDPKHYVIHITEATYGMNCVGFADAKGHQNSVSKGNVTTKISEICEGIPERCGFTVDIAAFGDPANGCGKDFSVSWRCGNSESAHRTEIPPEANGEMLLLTCP